MRLVWMALWTKPRCEDVAKQNVVNQGFDCLLPMAQRYRYSQLEVLFPRYLLVKLGVEGRWRCLEATRGVVCVVRFGDAPACVPDFEIDALQRRMDARGIVALGESRFSPGQRVQVSAPCSPLFGETGVLDAFEGQERARVLFAMLGRQAPVTLRETELVPA
jgi:transcriptional antiterminator RfaH